VENSSNDNQTVRRETLIAWRLKPSLLPMFKDLTQQAYEARLIREPKLTSLAKISLSFFAEMWLQQKAAQEQYEKQQLGSQRAPIKDINGNLITGPGSINRG
jgi:hypothetical protein